MSGIDPNARKEVNDALISSGGAAIGQMVDTANSSVEKRRRNKSEREKREAEEKAAKERADAAVSARFQTPFCPDGY
jgi:Cu/Ag efflux pump CusA